jgi:hypothetical protein
VWLSSGGGQARKLNQKVTDDVRGSALEDAGKNVLRGGGCLGLLGA